jgi:hypothetical protein
MNNVYKNCPAIMNDGRFLTDYSGANRTTYEIQKINGIPNSNVFRTFLQNNATKIMANENSYLKKKFGCNPDIACSEGYYFINSTCDPNNQ